MAYRPAPQRSLPVTQALRAAQAEVWLADALVARETKNKTFDSRIGALCCVFLFGSCGGLVGLSMLGGLSFLGLIVMAAIIHWTERDARALKRKAVRKGLPKGRLEVIEAEQNVLDLGDWRRRSELAVQWLTWMSGEPLSPAQCEALADGLAEVETTDPQQQAFIDAVRSRRLAA